MKHADIVNKMSLEQKAAFVSGFDYWHLEEAPELGLPKIMVTDGPHGLRKQNPNGDSVGLGNSYPGYLLPYRCYFQLLLGRGAAAQRGRGAGRGVLAGRSFCNSWPRYQH